jgi:putative salt-induced outer membrane protein YdiY
MRTNSSCFFALLALVGAVCSAHADTLVLANGDEINGEIIEWAVDHVVIEHPQLGEMRIALDELKLDTGEAPNPGLFGTRFLRGWSRHVDLGINGEQSNSSSLAITLGSRFAYDDPWTRWRANGRYFLNVTDDGDDNDNNATFDVKRDWLFPESRWFGFAGSRYQFDQFKTWKHRITLAAGPGVHLVDTEQHSFDLTVGPAFTREFGTSNASKGEALLGLTYDWKISERQSFDLDNQFFVEYRPNAGSWRNFTRLNWTLQITEHPALSVKAGIQNEYESNPEPGDKHNDLKYLLTLGVDL